MKSTIYQIVSVFETGLLPSEEAYATVTILNDGAGISYGKHQATARSGSLLKILEAYDAEPARPGQVAMSATNNPDVMRRLRAAVIESVQYSSVTEARAKSREVAWALDWLASAGSIREMRVAQDVVFEREYWAPTEKYCETIAVNWPLTYLAVYDTAIHSGIGRVDLLRQRFPEVPPSRGGDERAWTSALLRARRYWLRSPAQRPVVQRSAYRVDELQKLVSAGNWALTHPIVIRGVRIGNAA